MSAFIKPQTPAAWAILGLAVVIVLLGLPLAYMGAELMFLGGSWYYVIIGIAVTAAGVLMAMGRSMGAMLYLAAVGVTWLWAFWEVGFDGWGLLPRVFGPTILAIGVALCLPALRRMESAHSTSVREVA